MVDQSKVGTDWGVAELDAIVAEYFAMLEASQPVSPSSKRTAFAPWTQRLVVERNRSNSSI